MGGFGRPFFLGWLMYFTVDSIQILGTLMALWIMFDD